MKVSRNDSDFALKRGMNRLLLLPLMLVLLLPFAFSQTLPDDEARKFVTANCRADQNSAASTSCANVEIRSYNSNRNIRAYWLINITNTTGTIQSAFFVWNESGVGNADNSLSVQFYWDKSGFDSSTMNWNNQKCGTAVDLTAGTCNTTLLKEFNLSSLAANMQQVVNFTDAAKWEKEKGDGIFSIMARMNDEDFDGTNRESHPHAIGEPKNAAPMLNLTVLIDATKPIVNTTFNTSTPRNIDVLNFTGNISDETGLLSANWTINLSTGKVFMNYTISGTSAQVSNATSLYGLKGGAVLNFTLYATDTSNNVKQNSTLLTVTDALPPVVNASFNTSTPKIYDIINFTGNITDETGLLSANWTVNLSTGTLKINYSVSGAAATLSNSTFLPAAGVINFTLFATDTSNNVRQNSTLLTVSDNLRPAINGTLNATSAVLGSVINSSFNITDETGLLSGSIIVNLSTGKVFMNYSLSGTSATISNTTSVNCAPCVLNFTGLATDTSNNVKQNSTIIFVADSTRPIANSSFNLSAPKKGDIINFSANVTDDFSLHSANWTINMTNGKLYVNYTFDPLTAKATVSNSTAIVGGRGNVYNFSLRACDAFGNCNQNDTLITVANTPPSCTAGALNNTSPKTNDAINQTGCGYSDADGDARQPSSFSWYRNNALIAGQNAQTLNLSTAGNGDKGDTINGSEQPYDGFDYGNWVNVSMYALVQNSTPTTPVIANASGQAYNTNQVINWASSDADGDQILYTVHFNGPSFSTPDQNFTTTMAADGTYFLNVSAADGTGNSTNSSAWNITLDTTSPFTALSFNSSAPRNVDALNFTANVTDAAGLLSANWTINLSTGKVFMNYTISGTSAQVSNTTNLNGLVGGTVLNFTLYATDTVNNVRQNSTLFSISDSLRPAASTGFNSSSPAIGTIVNFTANVSDETGLLSANWTFNISGSVTKMNYTLSGASAQVSNMTALPAGGIVNFTLYVTDTSNNVRQSSTLLSVADTIPPVINGTLNKSSPGFQDVVNITFNLTDETGLLSGNITHNMSGTPTTISFPLSGTSAQISSKAQISCNGCVINFTGYAADASGNARQNSTVVSIGDFMPPVFNAAIPNVTIPEEGHNATLNLSDFITDANNTDEQITWRATGNSSVIVRINQTTKIANISGSANFTGQESIFFLATDGVFETASNEVVVTVLNVNDAPAITSVSPASDPTIASQSGSQKFNATFIDVDPGDRYNATWFRNGTSIAPSNASNVTVANLPTGRYNITVIVTDNASASARHEWALNVSSIIGGGELTSNVLSLSESERENATNVQVNRSGYGGIDFGSNILNFSGISNLEDAFNISRGLVSVNNGSFPGVNRSATIVMLGLPYAKMPFIFVDPGFESNTSGTLCLDTVCTNVTYSPSTGRLEFHVPHFSTYYTQANFSNGAPAITTAPKTSAKTGLSYTYDVDASDPDGDTLSFSLLAAPSGMGIGSSTGIISWTPASSQIGSSNVTVRVSDGNLTDNQSFEINVTKGPKLAIEEVDVKVDSKSSNNLVDGDSISRDAAPGSKVTFKVKVTSLFTDEEGLDINNVQTDITIRNIDDGDDIDEDAPDFDLSPGRSKTATIAFNIPLQVDEDTFDVDIEVEGEDDNGTTHTDKAVLTLEVNKEKHEIRILNAAVSPAVVRCEQSATVSVNALNTGEDDEDEAVIRVTSQALGYSAKEEASVDSGTDDNQFDRAFAIPLPKDLNEGSYPIDIRTYYRSDRESDARSITLEKGECVTTQSTSQQQPSAAEPAVEVVNQNIQPAPAEQPSVVEQEDLWQQFRESRSYAIALVSAIAMLTFLLVVMIGLAVARFLL